MDLLDPLAIGIDWTSAHWFAIMIAAALASLAVRAAKLVDWWMEHYR
jgi:hypothetical protein